MICLKCRKEIPDLSMYCPECGAPQFGRKEQEEIVLELADPVKSKVIITKTGNMTSALSAIRSATGLNITEIRKMLNELPAEILKGLSEEEAERIAKQLNEAGIEAHADHGRKDIQTESL